MVWFPKTMQAVGEAAERLVPDLAEYIADPKSRSPLKVEALTLQIAGIQALAATALVEAVCVYGDAIITRLERIEEAIGRTAGT